MDDRETRMRCIEQAVKVAPALRSSEKILDIADVFYKYVINSTTSGNGQAPETGSKRRKKTEPEGKKDGKLGSIMD